MKKRASDQAGADARGLILTAILDAAHTLGARLEVALGASGLSLAKLGVLRALADAPGPLALSEVAKRVHCVRSNITQLVDRLESDGLVRRVSDPTDRRVRWATLTPLGKKTCARGMSILVSEDKKLAAAMGRSEASALLRFVGRLME